MKHAIFLFVIWCMSQALTAQVVMNHQQAEAAVLSVDSLYQVYETAASAKEGEGVFSDERRAEFFQVYGQYHAELGKYLIDNGVKWEGRMMVPYMVFVNEQGAIDYMFINTAILDIPEESKKKYIPAAQEFLLKHPSLLPADQPYRQCTSVPYIIANTY